MTEFSELPPSEIGRRLVVARENINKSEQEVAGAIGISLSNLISIEKGDQLDRTDDLWTLAKFYKISVNSILRREAVHINLIPRFRCLSESQSEAVIEAAKLLNDLVRAEVELENLLGVKHVKNYPDEKDIRVGDVKALAKQHAKEVRDWLDVGSGPIQDIFSLIESKIGIRLFQKKLDTSISGLFVFDETIGACILLNASHPLRRRVYSAAHELGHFIGTRHSPETLEKGERFRSREELYADSFARSFLTPSENFNQTFQSIIKDSRKISREHVIRLAHKYNISREFCVRRLEELELVPKGTWDSMVENGGITEKCVREVLRDKYIETDYAKADAKKSVSNRIGLMATLAWEQELISEGVLSELLGLHRIALRSVLHENQSDGESVDDVLKRLNR